MMLIKQIYIDNKKPLLISLCFLALNLIQAYFTPLLNDESYYWLYAQNLDWGYFDHPPLIALLIKISTQIFSSEIGVRFIVVLLGWANIFLWLKIIEQETKVKINASLVFLLLGGSFFLTLYSFLAIPDTPLLFCTSLFFWFYSKFLKKDDWKTNLMLSVAIALLLYSKYHGVLIIFFTLLSNPKVFKRKSFYVVLAIALILFIPHLYWLYENDFQTIRFHLFERSGSKFKIDYVLGYIGEQLGITGPIFVLLFSILYKPKNTFQRALKYNVIGIFIFFLLSSFRQRLNTHWTAVAWMPMILLCYFYFIEKNNKNIFLKGLLILNVILVLGIRSMFLLDWFQFPHFNDKNPKVMAATLKELAGEKELVFLNNYIAPSSYMFYENEKSFAVNTLEYKRTQFNYMDSYEDDVQNKPVLLVSKNSIDESSKELIIPKGQTYYTTEILDFRSYFTTFLVKASNLEGKMKLGENYVINYIINHKLSEEALKVLNSSNSSLGLSMIHTKSKKEHRYQTPLSISKKEELHLEVKLPQEPGKYKCVFYIYRENHKYLKGFNSLTYFIHIE